VRSALRLLAATVLVAAACGEAAAARLPEWARSIADAAPAIPDGLPKYPFRVLFRGVALDVLPDGEGVTVREHIAIQILSARGDDARLRTFPFDDTAKLKIARGWSLPPGDSAQRARQEPFEITVPGAFLTDRRERWVFAKEAGRGALLFFEFEAEETPYALTWRGRFYEGVPIDRATLELTLPAGWDVKSAWLPGPGPTPTIDGARRRWEMSALEPADQEPLGDEPHELAPTLVLAFQPAQRGSSKRPTFSSWADVAEWYQRLAAGRAEPSPAIRVDAMAAMNAAGPDAIARDLAAARFVRDRVRYVAREMGIGGYQPHAAEQTYKDRAGDCKDKTTLLQAVLASDGRTSYPILVNATTPGTVAEDVPDAWAFNHAVLGVVIRPDAIVGSEAAIVNAGELGRLLVVDTTDEYASPGTLPANLADKVGLVAAGARGRLVRLPSARASDHRVETTLELELQPDRSITARLATLRLGQPAEDARRVARSDSEQRRADVARAIREAIPEAVVKTYEFTAESRDGAFLESIRLAVPAPPNRRIEPLVFFPGALLSLPRVPLTRRAGAVAYEYPRKLTYLTTVKGVPGDRPLPAGHRAAGDGWAIESSVTRDGSDVRASWALDLTRTRFAPGEFPELKQLWSAASRAASPLVPVE
jgi:hypothetical protein